MLLKHLYDFAQSRKLLDDLAFRADTPVRWLIQLDAEGNLLGQGPQETEGARKNKGKEFKVPKTSRATNSGTVADFLVDDIGAIFCLSTKPGEPANERATQKLQAKHQDFWRQIEEAKATIGDSRFDAVLKFKAGLGENGPAFLRLDEKRTGWLMRTASGDDKPLGSDLLTFVVAGEDPRPLFDTDAAKQHWRNVYAAEAEFTEEGAERGLCLITGDADTPLARIHAPRIKNIPNVGIDGAVVSFEKSAPAFSSYGKLQSYNAPCSLVATDAYCRALQVLVSHNDHSLAVGKTKVCFWAAQTASAGSLFARLLNRPDPQSVAQFLKSPWSGIEHDLARKDQFFAVTLAGNSGRIVVRHWLQEPLDQAIEHFHDWFADLDLVVPQRPASKTGKKAGASSKKTEFHPLSVFWLACTTVREAKDLAPDVPSQLYRAALEGAAPSVALIKPILDQLHSKLVRDENYQLLYDQSRFALLKLILNRQPNRIMEIKPELTSDTDDAAYNCGRLLAILSATQNKAHDYKLEGSGVSERYFGTASVSPASVFPLLLRLNRHHLNKIRKSERFGGHERFIEEQIQGVLSLFKPAKPGQPPVFPRTLDLQAQGRFALGFYQQQAAEAAARQAARDKKNDSETETN